MRVVALPARGWLDTSDVSAESVPGVRCRGAAREGSEIRESFFPTILAERGLRVQLPHRFRLAPDSASWHSASIVSWAADRDDHRWSVRDRFGLIDRGDFGRPGAAGLGRGSTWSSRMATNGPGTDPLGIGPGLSGSSLNPARPLNSEGGREGTVHVVVGSGRLVVGDCGVGDGGGAGGIEEESAAGPLARNGDEAVGAVDDPPERAGAGARPAEVGQAAGAGDPAVAADGRVGGDRVDGPRLRRVLPGAAAGGEGQHAAQRVVDAAPFGVAAVAAGPAAAAEGIAGVAVAGGLAAADPAVAAERLAAGAAGAADSPSGCVGGDVDRDPHERGVAGVVDRAAGPAAAVPAPAADAGVGAAAIAADAGAEGVAADAAVGVAAAPAGASGPAVGLVPDELAAGRRRGVVRRGAQRELGARAVEEAAAEGIATGTAVVHAATEGVERAPATLIVVGSPAAGHRAAVARGTAGPAVGQVVRDLERGRAGDRAAEARDRAAPGLAAVAPESAEPRAAVAAPA